MSKIPEGTQFIEAGCGDKGFRKFEKGCWWFFEGYWRHVDWKMSTLTPVTGDPRYVPPVATWSGDGLPPAGAVCEMCGSGAWYVVTMLGAGKAIALIQYDDGQEHAVQIASVKFRPIRTAEQIAAEEREATLTDIALLMGKDPERPRIREMAAILYDAGYRKQVQP